MHEEMLKVFCYDYTIAFLRFVLRTDAFKRMEPHCDKEMQYLRSYLYRKLFLYNIHIGLYHKLYEVRILRNKPYTVRFDEEGCRKRQALLLA